MDKTPRYDIVINFLAHQIKGVDYRLERMPIDSPYTRNQEQRNELTEYKNALIVTMEYVKSLETA